MAYLTRGPEFIKHLSPKELLLEGERKKKVLLRLFLEIDMFAMGDMFSSLHVKLDGVWSHKKVPLVSL